MTYEKTSTAHILVPRAAIPSDRVLTFELFVRVGGKFIKVANRDEKIDSERIDRYLNNEKDVLYIDRGSLERFMDEKFGVMFDMIASANRPVEERFDWYIRCLELGFIDLKIVRPHTDKFMRIEMLIEWSYEFFKNRELRKLLLRQMFWSVDQALTRRAIFGATLAMNLIMEQGDCTPMTFKSLFSGAVYRDIALALAEGSEDPHLHSPDELSEYDRSLFLKHSEMSVEVLRKYVTVDDMTRAIIEQHHELPRGNGFPRGLKRAETFQPAQYLNLADFTLTELERFRRTHGKLQEAEVLKHFQDVMPEENHKNLPLLLRVIHPIFG